MIFHSYVSLPEGKHGQELPCEFVSFMLEPMFRPCSNVEEMPRGSISGPLSKSQRRKAVQSTLQLFCAQRMTTRIALILSEPTVTGIIMDNSSISIANEPRKKNTPITA